MEEACEYGLTRGTCFTARRLDVVAVAGLLWIYSVVCFGCGGIFRFFFFIFFRPFIMLSDSELLICIFRSEKKMGLLMQSKLDGIKSDLRIRWPKSSDFGPKSDDSTHGIIKSKNGIGL